MAPKKSKTQPEPEKFETGDIVLCKVKGYPEWPGKIVDASTTPEEVKKAKQGKAFCVRFFPDGDYYWFGARELKPLPTKAIDAFLSDNSKKAGKLREGYTIARDPAEWEAEQARRATEEEEDVEEDVDMLEEDGEEKVNAAGKKRKRAAEPKKKETKKSDTAASKKRKTDNKADKAPKEKAAKGAAAATDKGKKGAAASTGADESSEGFKTVKGWRATLQKAFLTNGVPPAEKMPEFDTVFKNMEGFEMQTEWLTTSKLGKVVKRMSLLNDIARDDEFKIKERSHALAEKWKEMMVKEGGEEAAAAGDVTMAAGDEADSKKEPTAQKDEPAAEPEANGDKKAANGDSHAEDDKMETDAPAAATTNGEPAAEVKA